MLSSPYYAQNYAGIIDPGLLKTASASSTILLLLKHNQETQGFV